jgi:hypothetical protein
MAVRTTPACLPGNFGGYRSPRLCRSCVAAAWQGARLELVADRSILDRLHLLEVVLFPQYLPVAAGDFRKHMLQHLLMGMIAPLGLVICVSNWSRCCRHTALADPAVVPRSCVID